jgi:hypothetical protein
VSSKRCGSRKRPSAASCSAVSSPTSRPSVSVISAAFQSPPRARQKTRAGRVGDSVGFCRSAAQGPCARSSSSATSNQRRNSSGVSAPAISSSASASCSAPIAISRSIRASSTGAARPEPGGGSASASSMRRKSARVSGTPRSAWFRISPRTFSAEAGPQSARAKPVRSGGRSPTASRCTAPSGVTVIASGSVAGSVAVAGAARPRFRAGRRRRGMDALRKPGDRAARLGRIGADPPSISPAAKAAPVAAACLIRAGRE